MSNRFRNRPRTNFTTIRNTMLRDDRLSLKAKGLLALMLSFPDDWSYYMSHLETLSADGRDAHRSAARELIALGYVDRRQERDAEGKLSTIVYDVADYAADGLAADGFPGAGEPPTTKTYDTKTEESQELLSASPTSAPKPGASAKGIREESITALVEAWNEHSGTLPKVRNMSPSRRTGLSRMVRTCGNLNAALETMKAAASVVANDDWWTSKKYGLDNLLAGDKYLHRAEQYEAKTSSRLERRPEAGDTVVATVQVGAMPQKVTAIVEDVTDTQAHIKAGPRRYRVPFTAILEIK